MSLVHDNSDILQSFEAIWENIECGIFIIDVETRTIVEINQRAASMFGRAKDQIIGKHCHDFICPEKMNACPIMDKGQSVDRSERTLLRADGRIIPISKSVTRITYKGRPALLESFLDISKLKQVETELVLSGVQEQTRLQNILNGMNALITVADIKTNKILFLNDAIRNHFGITGDYIGQLCHKVLQGLEEPCPSCPYNTLREDPDKVIIWEHREVKKGGILHKVARLIDWPGVGKAHLEYALDITELRTAQDALEQRETMLGALNRAAIVLLSQSEETFEETVTEGCRIISDMARLDRLSVWKNFQKPDGLHVSQIYRWDWKSNDSIKPTEALVDVAASQFAPHLEALLSAGGSINGPVRSLPEAEMLRSFGCISIFVNPIFINNTFWGFVLCEDRSRERIFTEDEVNALRSASFMLANVVMRHEEATLIREANERVTAQAHWYKSILDAMPIPISVTDVNMNWTLTNKAVETMLGVPEAEMLGKPCRNWNASICGTEQCGVACVKRGVTRTFFNQNGSSYQVDVATLKDLSGNLTGFIEVVQDITQVERMARQQGEMEKNISRLEIEADKIFYDPLTEVYNRRFLVENIDRLIRSLSRSAGVLSLLMVDIDYFKQYNDTYGHISGDDCLKLVAETLRGCMVRQDDFVARYGGEEFVVVLPSTDAIGAHMIAGKMLDAVRNRAVPHIKSDVADRVTVSIGVVTGKVKYTHSRDDFLKRADEMLYESKQNGRNRYSFAML